MSLQIFVCPNSANSYIQLIKEEPQTVKEEPDHPWISKDEDCFTDVEKKSESVSP